MQAKPVFFPQRIIKRRTAAQGDFTLVFGIRRADDKRFFWMLCIDKQRNQLRRAVSDDNIFQIRTDIIRNARPQRDIVPVRISGDRIDALRKRFAQCRRYAKRIDICGKTGDGLFFYPIKLLDFFQVAAVEMVFMLYHNASSFERTQTNFHQHIAYGS